MASVNDIVAPAFSQHPVVSNFLQSNSHHINSMAKSKNRNRGCPPPTNNGNPRNNANNKKGGWCANNIDLTQEAIDRHWQALPDGTKDFILSSTQDGMFPLSKLIKFWDSSANRECTDFGIAGSMCGAMW